MGKPTGFMDYKRETSVSEAPLERIRNFNEFRSEGTRLNSSHAR